MTESEELFNDIETFLKDNDNTEKLLNETEVEILITSFVESQKEGEEFSEDEIFAVIRWAEGVRIEQIMLGFVLDGTCDIDWKDGEPTFRLSEFGKQRLESSKDKYGLN